MISKSSIFFSFLVQIFSTYKSPRKIKLPGVFPYQKVFCKLILLTIFIIRYYYLASTTAVSAKPKHTCTIFLLCFLAHLSRRLIGELIVYQWSGVRHPSIRRPSVVRPQCSKIFFSETPRPIKAKFYEEPPWVGGTIFCSRHLGHMTKMAATSIYGKNPSKIFFARTGGPIFMKLGMQHRGLQPIIVCSNDDP